MGRRSSGADGSGPDLSVFPDGRLSPREVPPVAANWPTSTIALSESLQKRMEANQVQAADVALARVESRATRQLVKAAQQDYLTALTDLRNQIGIPEQAGAVEPLGEFTLPPYIPPIDEQVMIQEALQSRPDIHAANAQVAGTYSAVKLAKGDRIPTPVIGPQYAMDEAGVQYIGFVLISPLPIWNSGKPLVSSARPSIGGPLWRMSMHRSVRPPKFERPWPSGMAQPSW